MTLDGRFLTFEGVDGAGKSTHLEWVAEYLRSHNISVLLTREPGGTAIGERLRDLLLNEPMHLETETLLMFAARCEHVRTVIEPAIAQGKWVVCDRFTDATYAYQGAGRLLGVDRVKSLQKWVHPNLQPDRTWLFDLDLDIARERLTTSRSLDRFEREDVEFFIRTRDGYHDLVRQAPERFCVVDASQSIESIRVDLKKDLDDLLAKYEYKSQARDRKNEPVAGQS